MSHEVRGTKPSHATKNLFYDLPNDMIEEIQIRANKMLYKDVVRDVVLNKSVITDKEDLYKDTLKRDFTMFLSFYLPEEIDSFFVNAKTKPLDIDIYRSIEYVEEKLEYDEFDYVNRRLEDIYDKIMIEETEELNKERNELKKRKRMLKKEQRKYVLSDDFKVVNNRIDTLYKKICEYMDYYNTLYRI